MKTNINTVFLNIIVFSLLFSNLINAKEVTPSVAQNVAINAFSQIANKLKTELKISESFPIKQDEITLFTILNFEGGGHIIPTLARICNPCQFLPCSIT